MWPIQVLLCDQSLKRHDEDSLSIIPETGTLTVRNLISNSMTDLHKFSDISEKIDRAILVIRGKKVMIDSDLAEIFGIRTKRLNEQVKRNIYRFPKDFMFQLTTVEK